MAFTEDKATNGIKREHVKRRHWFQTFELAPTQKDRARKHKINQWAIRSKLNCSTFQEATATKIRKRAICCVMTKKKKKKKRCTKTTAQTTDKLGGSELPVQKEKKAAAGSHQLDTRTGGEK